MDRHGGIDADRLRSFVAAAHENGYATTAAEAGSFGKVITYEAGELRYEDHYFGSRAFVGLEAVFAEGDPVWGMCYRGEPTAPDVDHEPVYAFLRDALAAVPADRPYRGPESYVDEPFAYRAAASGDIGRVSGTETIEREGSVVYRGRFAGGRIE